MSVLNIQEQITGGESVYCINQAQILRTRNIVASNDESGEKVRESIEEMEKNLSRNERAAVAFSIIERLNGNF